METQIMELEKKQSEVTNKYRKVFSRLEGSYKKSEELIDSINKKRLELATVRKRLWKTVIIMVIIVIVAALVKKYL